MSELIWDGKYVNGKKTAPVRLALPFQDVETVYESAQTRTLTLDLWGRGEEREWRNRLVWGDKKYVLASLLPEFAGKVNLIYMDLRTRAVRQRAGAQLRAVPRRRRRRGGFRQAARAVRLRDRVCRQRREYALLPSRFRGAAP